MNNLTNLNLTKSKLIKINMIEDLKELVNKAAEVEDEVLLQHGYYIINCKSILGVLSLDLSKEVNIVYPAYAVEFEQFVENFEVVK